MQETWGYVSLLDCERVFSSCDVWCGTELSKVNPKPSQIWPGFSWAFLVQSENSIDQLFLQRFLEVTAIF